MSSRAQLFVRTIIPAIVIVGVLVVINMLGVLAPLRWVLRMPDRWVVRPIETTDERVVALEQKVSSLKSVAEENVRLRDMLGFKTKVPYPMVAVNVLRIDRFAPSLVYIDRGTDDGVHAGNAVVSGDTLIGVITKTTEATSVVEYLHSPHIKMPVALQGETEIRGLLTGGDGGSLVVDFVDDQRSFSVGDTVVTTAAQPYVPPGLLIGTVSQVVETSDGLFKRVRITPPFDYTEQRSLFILTL